MSRRLLAEGLGTAFLLAAVIGSGVMAQRLTSDVGLMLLANSLSVAAILMVLITLFGPVSGASFNPAVTIALAWRSPARWRDLASLVAVQVSGAVAGVMLAHLMFDLPAWQTATTTRSGAGQWLSEGIATFGLVLTIIGGSRHRPEGLPGLVALYVLAAFWFTASTCFANPAVTIARTLSDTFAGIAPGDAPAFLMAQGIGAALAVAAAAALFPAAARTDAAA